MTESTEATSVAMDQYVDLVKRWREATKARMGWAKIEEDIKAEIDKILADSDQATINGQIAVERRRENRFAMGEFKRRDPEMARYFEVERTVRTIDVDLIKSTRPDLYKEYQVVKLINKFDG